MICANCQKREAKHRWGGIDYCRLCSVRAGGFDRLPQWCDVCVLEAQLEYAMQRAEAVPELKTQLAKARTKNPLPMGQR